MESQTISQLEGHARSARVGRQSGNDRYRLSRATGLGHFMLLAIGAYFCSSLALWAQTSDSQTSDANKSWTATTLSQEKDANPTRTINRHTSRGNRTLDEQSVLVRLYNNHFQPYQDTEVETVQVDATTVRTTTRGFARDFDGRKVLVQVIEVEEHTRPGGESEVIRNISNPDIYGKLQFALREVEETRRISAAALETTTTVIVPSIKGGVAPAVKIDDRRQQRSDGATESERTTLVLDIAGEWQVAEVRQATSRQEGNHRITEERVSLPDFTGKLAEVSRTVSKETESTSGEKRTTVETYSVDVPGWTRDGSLHLVERSSAVQRTSPTGEQTTEQQIALPDFGNPTSSPQVTRVVNDKVQPNPSGAQATRTVQVRDGSGLLRVFSVDATEADSIEAFK